MVGKRIKLILFLLLFAFLIAGFRILQLKLFQREEYILYIEKQYYTVEEINLPRGSIYDAKGNFIAISVPTLTVYVIPKFIKDKESVAKQLSLLLKIPYKEIYKKLTSRKNYTVISTNVDKTLKPQILKLRSDLKEWNIGIIDNSVRIYPYGKTAGSTVGFVSKKTGLGMEGLEKQLNDYLGGGKAKIQLLKDAQGNLISIEKVELGKLTYNAVLTIDMNVQYIAEEALNKLVNEKNPLEAAILIMNPHTGEILAAATYPNYDPNNYEKYKTYKNIIFQHAYEIGSIAKPIFSCRSYDEKRLI
jgi:Cell division protein FtsI/penicillin-binding protein 2